EWAKTQTCFVETMTCERYNCATSPQPSPPLRGGEGEKSAFEPFKPANALWRLDVFNKATQTMRGKLLFLPMLCWLALAGFQFEVAAQTNEPQAERWLEAAAPVPEFAVPGSRVAWEKRRKE